MDINAGFLISKETQEFQQFHQSAPHSDDENFKKDLCNGDYSNEGSPSATCVLPLKKP